MERVQNNSCLQLILFFQQSARSTQEVHNLFRIITGTTEYSNAKEAETSTSPKL